MQRDALFFEMFGCDDVTQNPQSLPALPLDSPDFDYSPASPTADRDCKKVVDDALAAEISGPREYLVDGEPLPIAPEGKPLSKLFHDLMQLVKRKAELQRKGCSCDCEQCQGGDCSNCGAEEKCAGWLQHIQEQDLPAPSPGTGKSRQNDEYAVDGMLRSFRRDVNKNRDSWHSNQDIESGFDEVRAAMLNFLRDARQEQPATRRSI